MVSLPPRERSWRWWQSKASWGIQRPQQSQRPPERLYVASRSFLGILFDLEDREARGLPAFW